MTVGKVSLDPRRRTSLAKFGRKEDSEYLVDEQPDGTLVLTPAVTISATELAILREPELRDSLSRPFERSELRSRGSYAKYAE